MRSDSFKFVTVTDIDNSVDAVCTDAVMLDDSMDAVMLDDHDMNMSEGEVGDFIMLAEDAPLLSEIDTWDVSLAGWDMGTDNDVLVIV
ncbi:MAG: hypothetical protein LBU03_05690 [Tannerellaceae bacterium]|jgi:hypothetical protein|nr:hypothetical protein [Tannerellaceae bacterium]